MPPLGSNRLLEILLAFSLLYFNADTPITDFVYALFDLVQPTFLNGTFPGKSWKRGFLSPGKPWNSVFASPGKKHLNVCTNPVMYKTAKNQNCEFVCTACQQCYNAPYNRIHSSEFFCYKCKIKFITVV